MAKDAVLANEALVANDAVPTKFEAVTAPVRLILPVVCVLVVTMPWMVLSSLLKYNLPSAVLIASSPASKLEVEGILPATADLFSLIF